MPIADKSNSVIARVYRRTQIYDVAEGKKGTGTIISVPHNGRNLRMQQEKPLLPVKDYEDWLRSRNYYWQRNAKITGAKLRRIVIMKRQGSTWGECGYAVGVAGSTAAKWVEFLPPHLGV